MCELKQFEMVHLNNIKNYGEGTVEDDIEDWVDNLNEFGNRAKYAGDFQLASKAIEINRAILEDHDMQEFKKDTNTSDLSAKTDSLQGSTSKEAFITDPIKLQQLKEVLSFIASNDKERAYFNKNGNKDMYA